MKNFSRFFFVEKKNFHIELIFCMFCFFFDNKAFDVGTFVRGACGQSNRRCIIYSEIKLGGRFIGREVILQKKKKILSRTTHSPQFSFSFPVDMTTGRRERKNWWGGGLGNLIKTKKNVIFN